MTLISPLGGAGGGSEAPLDAEPGRDCDAGGRSEDPWSILYPVIVPDDTLATIPGVGEDCGLQDRFSKRKVICSVQREHHHYEVDGSSCGKPSCPRHWTTWARRATDRVGRVIWGYKEASKGRHKPRHTILSEDENSPLVLKRASFSDKSNVRYFRKHFTRKALSLGGTGGSMIVHLWRTNDRAPTWMEGLRRWDWVRKQGVRWRDYVKFSPHAHINGYGFYQEPTAGDFRYRNLDPLDDRDAVESVTFYQLSHAPIGAGCNAVTYWGCCQPGNLKVMVMDGKKQQWTERVPVFCDECKAPMIYEDDGCEYLRKRSCAIYLITVPGVGPP